MLNGRKNLSFFLLLSEASEAFAGGKSDIRRKFFLRIIQAPVSARDLRTRLDRIVRIGLI